MEWSSWVGLTYINVSLILGSYIQGNNADVKLASTRL